jgi:putative flippase GtrA
MTTDYSGAAPLACVPTTTERRSASDQSAAWPAAPRRHLLERFARFGGVGLSGLAINEAALAICVAVGMGGVAGTAIATQCSTMWNFSLVEWWAFRGSERARSRWQRCVLFFLMNNFALLLRAPIIFGLTVGLGVNILLSNLVSLGVMTVVRFTVADSWIWREPRGLIVAPTDGLIVAPTDALPVASRDEPSLKVRPSSLRRLRAPLLTILPVGGVLAVAAFLRFWALGRVGFNSDEAVYAGQAASIGDADGLADLFPIYRAHPLLFQSLLSFIYRFGVSDFGARAVATSFGIATVILVYFLGKQLYGHRVGVMSAALLAVMPYHVAVSRQALLDTPEVFFATLALYALARYVITEKPSWMYALGGALGLTFLAKETGILLVGSVFAFLVLRSDVRARLRHLAGASLILIAMVLVYPLSVAYGGASGTGREFVVWQLLRQPNHGAEFYVTEVAPKLGIVVLLLALVGIVALWSQRSWRETLLLSWIVVPVVFFQLWPVKGFQYLLPIAPPVAVLAGRLVGRARLRGWHRVGVVRIPAVVISALLSVVLVVGLLVPAWSQVAPAPKSTFLAGTGGVPRGREAGLWIRRNIPENAQLVALGPSMANILQFYGHRKVLGLSVSTNELHRNPVYEPVGNADLRLRNGEIQYLVWDSFSAERAPSFAAQLLGYVEKFHGHVVHSESISERGTSRRVIVIYAVRP